MSDDAAPSIFERVLALKKLTPFAELPPEDLAPLAACMVPRAVPAGAALPGGGEDGGSAHVLLEGRVREDGRSREAPALLGMRDVLAETAPAARVAEVESRTLEIARPALLAVLADEFEVWLATLRHVCAQAPRPGSAAVGAGGPVGAAAQPGSETLADRITSLRRCAPFAGLGIHPLGEIASEANEVAFEPGRVLWRRGDAAAHLLAIESGALRCTEGTGPPRDAGPGALPGLTESLCARRFDYRAEARGAVRALRIDVEALLDVLEDAPEAGVEMLCVIARGPRLADPASTPGGVRHDDE